ncbi:MAG: hypothetical protein ACTSRS_11515 [Candidatus Helarchaeota archaeon]
MRKLVIEGSWRLPLLTLEWIFTIISVEVAIVFILKYLKQEKTLRTKQNLGYTALFFGLFLAWGFFVVGDFFISNMEITPFLLWSIGSWRELALNLGSISVYIGIILFCFSIEKYRLYGFKRYFFTICAIIMFLIVLFVFFFNLELSKYFSPGIWFIFFTFLIIYYNDFFKTGLKKENSFTQLLKFIPNYLFIAINFFITSDLFASDLLEVKFFGASTQLIAITLLFYFSIKLPPFAEFNWRQKIDELYVLNSAGVCLFHQSFTVPRDYLDEHLKSGAIASVNIILKSLTPTQKRQKTTILKKDNKMIYIYAGEVATAVLISQEEFNSILYNLEKFINKIELIYYNVLLRWKGDTDVFAPLEAIAKEFFF